MTDQLPVTAAVTPEPLPPDWDPSDTFAMARLLSPDQTPSMVLRVLKQFSLTPGQFETLRRTELFERVYTNMTDEWNSIKSTEQRIRHRSKLVYEAALPVLSARLSDGDEPLDKVAQLAKVIADVAALSRPEASQHAVGERISIQIDLGADTRLVFDKSTVQGSVHAPISTDGGGESDSPQIQYQPEGPREKTPEATDSPLERSQQAISFIPEGAPNTMELRPLSERAQATPELPSTTQTEEKS